MSTIAYNWHTSNPPGPDVYTTRKGDSKYQTLRYWDSHRWWQIEWSNKRGIRPFVWPKNSRTSFPSGMASYRNCMTLRTINKQSGIQWGDPYKDRQMPVKRTLADLRPNATITCLRCCQTKPQAGAIKFRAHHVCQACAVKLQALPAKEKRNDTAIGAGGVEPLRKRGGLHHIEEPRGMVSP